MKHPYNLPQRLLNHCESLDQFFLDSSGTKRRNMQFRIYLETLLYRPSEDPYDLMFRAALDQDFATLAGMAKRNNLAQVPVFLEPLSNLLSDSTSTQDDSILSLLVATKLIKQGKLSKDNLHNLLEKFPEHQENLLRLAYINNSPADWGIILDQKKYSGLACLALSKAERNSRELAAQHYFLNQTMLNFYCWLLLDPKEALKALPNHPAQDEIIKLLVLHGDAALLLEHSFRLATIEYSQVMHALSFFFDTQIKMRPGLSLDEDDSFDIADPFFIKNLLQKRPPAGRSRALIQKMIQHCSGEAMIYFKLREKICQ